MRLNSSRIILKHLVLFGLISGLSAHSVAADDCTAEQKAEADSQLMAIMQDGERQSTLIKTHMPFGVHTSTHEIQGNPDNETLLLHEGYVLLHDNDLRTGLWVSYRLKADDIERAEGAKRVNCFRSDPRLSTDERATPSDYSEPIYDQGHLANDADLKDNLIEQLNSYVMSNMSPQHCRFNRGIWLSLEHLGRAWAEKYGELFIVSGAVFDYNPRDKRDRDSSAGRMGSRTQKARVAIPSDYYKIFLRKDGDTWHSISFLLEHNNARNGADWDLARPVAEKAITSLEAIDAKAEAGFFPTLDRATLEQSLNGENWDFDLGRDSFESSCN